MLPFPHIRDQLLFELLGYPLRTELGPGLELNTSVNGRSRKLTVKKRRRVRGDPENGGGERALVCAARVREIPIQFA
jgi:hypothetical protein